MSHRLTVEFQSGVFVATCSCGEWTVTMMAQGSERASDVYKEVEAAHALHTEKVGVASSIGHPNPEGALDGRTQKGKVE